MPRVDPGRSRVVLVGSPTYDDPELPNVAAVEANVVDLAAVLTDPRLGGFSPAHCFVAPRRASVAQIGDLLVRAAAEAEDLLLFYYSGHGLLGQRRRELYLSVAGTRRDQLAFTAVSFDAVRDACLTSRARSRVVILDCCFSGRAIGEVLSGPEQAVMGQVEVAGAYTLTSAPGNRTAVVVPGEKHTAFTGRLLSLLRNGIPDAGPVLSLGQIYKHLYSRLAADALPLPQQCGTETADLIGLVHNLAPHSTRSPATTTKTAPQVPTPLTKPAPPTITPTSSRRFGRRALIVSGGVLVAGVACCAALPFLPHSVGGVPIPGTADPGLRPFDVYNDAAGDVGSVAFHPNGTLLAGASNDGKVRVWDVPASQRVAELSLHTGEVRSVAFSLDGKTLASAGTDDRVVVYTVDSEFAVQATLTTPQNVDAVAFGQSPSGTILAGGGQDNKVRLWDLAKPPPYPILGTLENSIHDVRSLAFAPNASVLASAHNDWLVYLWDVVKLDLIGTLAGHTDEVWSVAFSPDGKTLASSGRDGTVRLWELASRQLIGQPMSASSAKVNAVAFHPNGRLLAAASDKIRLWDLTTRTIKTTLAGSAKETLSVSFNADGKTIAGGGVDDNVRLWHLTG